MKVSEQDDINEIKRQLNILRELYKKDKEIWVKSNLERIEAIKVLQEKVKELIELRDEQRSYIKLLEATKKTEELKSKKISPAMGLKETTQPMTKAAKVGDHKELISAMWPSFVTNSELSTGEYEYCQKLYDKVMSDEYKTDLEKALDCLIEIAENNDCCDWDCSSHPPYINKNFKDVAKLIEERKNAKIQY